MYIEINGLNLYYEVYGEGEPLLMVHGSGQDHSIFYEAADILEHHFTCYLLDMRGHGQSEDVDDLRYEWMADDVNEFIYQLGLSPVHYYGFSDGGNIGLIAASRCPDFYRSLMVSGACLNPHGAETDIYRDIKYNSDWDDPRIRLLLFEPHIRNEDLHTITARTLVLAGEYDLILPSHTRRIAREVPDATLKIVRGENHGSYIEHNPKLARIILDFLCPRSRRRRRH